MKLWGVERRIVRAIMEALLPAGGDEQFPLSALDTGAEEMFQEMLLYLPAMTGLGLRAALWLIELGGPLLGLKKRARFSRLSLEEGEQCLAALAKSKTYLVRQFVLLLKSVACLAWCGDPRVRTALGHHLPPKFVQRQSGARP